MGNHELYAPDPERVATEVDGCGVRLLRNDNVIIAKNGARLALLGIDDVGRADRAAAHMQSAARGVPTCFPHPPVPPSEYHPPRPRHREWISS